MLDDPANYPLNLPTPVYPKMLQTFTIEFWFMFPVGDSSLYDIMLLSDYQEPNYF